mmetsp:Transcript_10677/g.13978  ORF Transcript_10677/g.13978 Transcript_10677/m.13978 type:complete len:302 (-) Transcript_10677:499-1404(-)
MFFVDGIFVKCVLLDPTVELSAVAKRVEPPVSAVKLFSSNLPSIPTDPIVDASIEDALETSSLWRSVSSTTGLSNESLLRLKSNSGESKRMLRFIFWLFPKAIGRTRGTGPAWSPNPNRGESGRLAQGDAQREWGEGGSWFSKHASSRPPSGSSLPLRGLNEGFAATPPARLILARAEMRSSRSRSSRSFSSRSRSRHSSYARASCFLRCKSISGRMREPFAGSQGKGFHLARMLSSHWISSNSCISIARSTYSKCSFRPANFRFAVTSFSRSTLSFLCWRDARCIFTNLFFITCCWFWSF